MTQITQEKTREIIRDFADAIKSRKSGDGVAPEFGVIDFRNWSNVQKPIDRVPIELLRYRKNNGRIASDILQYESNGIRLDEQKDAHQKILGDLLYNKDPKQTEVLMRQLDTNGQREPAIITADGFLINGNRRKVAFERLFKKTHEDRFRWMKVVILPDLGDPGGPPTIREIQQVENRCQLQKSGKSDYYDFDKAITFRDNKEKGMTLEEQLNDDPEFASLDEAAFRRAVRKHEKDYLEPLRHIDDYLEYLGTKNAYGRISKGPSDKEGRWEAFLMYSKNMGSILEDEKKRIQHNINENEIGKLKDAIYKVIRKRTFPIKEIKKLNLYMRELPKIIKNKKAKKELFHLNDIPITMEKKYIIDKDGKEKSEREKDRVWGKLHEQNIISTVKKSYDFYSKITETENPIRILDDALKKLHHPKLNSNDISDFDTARGILKDIRERAQKIESEIYQHKKNLKKLSKKKN